ncbi:MAG: hypothetical protein JXB62_22930, partial [Pirellulales bacterium]|nr:hypothetical protein [Pirellulales bacterium]
LLGNDHPGDESSHDENAYTVAYAADLAEPVRLDGLTITGGRAYGDWDGYHPEWRQGAGLYLCSSEVAVSCSKLSGNSARSGGGIFSYLGTLTVTGSTILGNSSSNDGGGVYSSSGTMTLAGTTISGNAAGGEGGGIYNRASTLVIGSSTITGNAAAGTSGGGGIYNEEQYEYYNNTHRWGGKLTLTNTIVALNSAPLDQDMWGGTIPGSGFNLIGVAPRFVRNPSAGADGTWGTADDDYGDLHLTDRSPAIEMGNNAFVPPHLVTDFAGNARIHGASVDIGAYEFQGDPAAGREAPSSLVTTLADVLDLYDGQISLREAVWYQEAPDRVTFEPALGGGEIVLGGASIFVDRSISIDASGLQSLVIDADGKSGAFTAFAEEVDLIGLTITGGVSDTGGGIWNWSDTLTIRDSVITANSTSRASGHRNNGGGVCNHSGAITIANSTILGNTAGVSGGGIYNASGALTITTSTVSGNVAAGSSYEGGGGICNVSGTMTITDSTILGNSSSKHRGGGIYNGSGTLTISGSTISENAAYGGGSGIYNSGTLMVADSIVAGNSSGHGGAAIHKSWGTMELTGSIMVGNSCANGAIYNGEGTLAVNSSTIAGNSHSGIGNKGTLTITNTIVALNGDPQDLSVAIARESGYNLIGVDPRFVRNPDPGADGTWGTADDDWGDLHLTDHSPAIEMGNNAFVPPDLVTDLDGNARIYGASVDIGVYEFQAAPPAGRETPSSLVTTLADVLDLYDGQISLREAVWYRGADQHITFDAALDGGEIILGGTSILVDRSISIDASGLDSLGINADRRSRVFTIFAEETALTGLTITGGGAEDGGGIYNDSGTLTISGSVISDNRAADGGRGTGGGIYNRLGTLTITGTTISGNAADYGGAGVYNQSGPVVISGTIISGNRGGGIHNESGPLTVSGSVISDNWTWSYGGGICTWSGTLTVIDSTISGNSATGGRDGKGGGICHWSRDTLTVIGSTISGNDADVAGGGILTVADMGTIAGSIITGNTADARGGGICTTNATLTINSTIVGNSATGPSAAGGGIYSDDSLDAALTMANTIVALNTARFDRDFSGTMTPESGFNLIGVDPRFVRNPCPGADETWGTADDDWGDLRLTERSPAIEMGNNASVPPDLATDFDGNARLYGPRVDIGAYEFQGAPPPGRETPSSLVTTLDDVFDLYDGELSLREAVWYPEAPARVTFDAALGGGEIVLDGASIVVDRSISIDASGLASLVINAEGKSRVFTTFAEQVELSGLTITGGDADSGGGIHSGLGVLTVSGSTISGNSARLGGGTSNAGGTLTLSNTIVSDNTALSGGAIYNAYGTLTLSDSTVSGNSTSFTAHYINVGGGIYNLGTLTIVRSAILGNSACDDGGGIYSRDGTSTIINSAIAGNSAGGYGGGIYNYSGNLTVANCTVSGNSAADGGGGIGNGEGTPMLANSIVAGNEGDIAPDVSGTLHDQSDHNLIGIWSSTATPPNSLCGTAENPIDPCLLPLGDYGGPTWTMPPAAGSPAIDAGDPDPADPRPTDQRGFGRFVDGDGDGNATIDIGAVEYVPDRTVVLGRYVFYNHSTFDGNDPAADEHDDAAVATDKVALLPGQTASFQNYTGYARGINGVMVDIASLTGTPIAADFAFKIGNDDDPGAWATAPEPSSIAVRPGEGLGGSDRVTLVWSDYAIQKQWLQVTVLATERTGLAVPDVFYFGNAVGEAGNSPTDARVDAADMLLARNNPRTFLDPAEIDCLCDFNRDGRVNATDVLIARNNHTDFLTALRLISVPAGKAGRNPPPAAAGLPYRSVASPAARLKTFGDRLESPLPWPGNGNQKDSAEATATLKWRYEFEPLEPAARPSGERGQAEAALDEQTPVLLMFTR